MDPTGEVIWGQNVTFTCSVTEGRVGGLFIFRKTPGPFIQTVNSNNNAVSFQITVVGLEDEGLYQCQFQRIISNQYFNTSFSDPVQLAGNSFLLACRFFNIENKQPLCRFTITFPKLNITIQLLGELMRGDLVHITCSISGGQVVGSFIFTKTPGPLTRSGTSSSKSGTLHIHQVNFADEGLYQCKFQRADSTSIFSDHVHLNLTGNSFSH